MNKHAIWAGALAAACLVGEAQAGVVFSQDFSRGLGANERVAGAFSVAGGTVGHQLGYRNNDSSYYQLRLDLTKVTNATLAFDFDVATRGRWDGFNVAYATGGEFPLRNLLVPETPGVYQSLWGRASQQIGADGISGVSKGRIVFDLGAFEGGIVDLRFQFASDLTGGGAGVKLDNILVGGDMPSAVPEPASWAMMIAGFGLTGGAIRSRRRTFSATAA